MAELAISELIKIILGVLVVVAVLIALYMFFKNQVLNFFSGFAGNSSKFFMPFLR